MTTSPDPVALAKAAANAAWDKKATDIVAIDVSGVLFITDVFVVCSAANPRHAAGIVDEIEHRVRSAGGLPARREGLRDASWVLLDFTDIVVHIQLAEERANYGLERLWRDCPSIALELAEQTPEAPQQAS
jgi:ribosome-associated protein